jgi:hypothetical protein
MSNNWIDYSKPFYTMTDEEVITEAMRAARDYLEGIRSTREFKLEACVRAELKRMEVIWRHSVGIRPFEPLDKEQKAEWEKVRGMYQPRLTELTLAIQRNYVRESKVSRVNASVVKAVLPEAFKKVGLKAAVTGQVHRALVEITLPTSKVRFYVRYKDLEREGMVDDVVKAVLDLKDAVTRLGFGAVVKTRKDRDGGKG